MRLLIKGFLPALGINEVIVPSSAIRPGSILRMKHGVNTAVVKAVQVREYVEMPGCRLEGGEVICECWASPNLSMTLQVSQGESVVAEELSDVGEAERVVVTSITPFYGSPDDVKELLLGRPVTGGTFFQLDDEGGTTFVVNEVYPDPAIVSMSTNVVLSVPSVEEITFDDIGGYKHVKDLLSEAVITPFQQGVPPVGLLLVGVTGVGKTMFVKALANELGLRLVRVDASSLLKDSLPASQLEISELFNDALSKDEDILLCIENVHLLAPAAVKDPDWKVGYVLAWQLDQLSSANRNVLVVGTAPAEDEVSKQLRRPGRFDVVVQIPVPDHKDRQAILEVLFRKYEITPRLTPSILRRAVEELDEKCKAVLIHIVEKYAYEGPDAIEEALRKEELLEKAQEVVLNVMTRELARRTHGFVAADLVALVRKAISLSLGKKKLSLSEFEEALKYVSPSALKEIIADVEPVHYDDIGGYEKVKQALREVVEWPLSNPELFDELGVDPPQGVLLFGPPGTGKTLLAKAVATESGANFIGIKAPEVLSKWVGESEKRIRELFRRARQIAPSIIFIDEIDAIAASRGRDSQNTLDTLINQLLTEMDGLEQRERVVVLAATNRPDILDPALLRPGRFDRLILVPAPDEKARLEILKVHTKKVPLKNVSLDTIARKTDGYTGADLKALVREAAIEAVRDEIKRGKRLKEIQSIEVTQDHFDRAMRKVKPSVTPEVRSYYERLDKRLKAMIAGKLSERPGTFW